MDPTTPGGFGGSEAGDMPTPGADHGDGDGDRDEGGDGDAEEEGDIDEDLAAELDLALGDDDEGEGDDEDEDDDESESDEDDEDDEAVQAKKLLNEEIRDLEAAVTKKNHEIASSANPLIRVRAYRPPVLATLADIATAAPLRGCTTQTSGRPGHEARSARRDERKAPPATRRWRDDGCVRGWRWRRRR